MTDRESIAVAPDGTILCHPDGVIDARVLDPCAREGAAGDWWTARHRSCTGSHSMGPGQRVRCSCSCHEPPFTAEQYLLTLVRPGVSIERARELFKAERCECGKPACRGWRCVRLNVGLCACGHVDESHRPRWVTVNGGCREDGHICEQCDADAAGPQFEARTGRPWRDEVIPIEVGSGECHEYREVKVLAEYRPWEADCLKIDASQGEAK